MSKRIKSKGLVDSDSENSDGESEVCVTIKKKAKKPKASTSASKGEDDNAIFALTSKRQVTVRTFKGKIYVDIREFYEDDAGELKPGKKGISLPVEQWKKLTEMVDDIDGAVEKLQG